MGQTDDGEYGMSLVNGLKLVGMKVWEMVGLCGTSC